MHPHRNRETRIEAGEEIADSSREPARTGRLRVVHDATETRDATGGGAEPTAPDRPEKMGRSDWSALMALAQDGDGAAYQRLLTEIAPYLRGLASRYLKNPAAIEDAVQDTLLTIHQLRHTYDPRRPFGPWLAMTAKRRSIDRFRREARQNAREAELKPDHETFAVDQTNSFVDSGDRRALYKAVEALPPGQREAIQMLKLGEMSLAEASLASGKSVSALKVATHRALKSLVKTLAGTEQ